MATRPHHNSAPAPAPRPALSAGDLLRTARALGVQDAATLQQLAGQLGLAGLARQPQAAVAGSPTAAPGTTPATPAMPARQGTAGATHSSPASATGHTGPQAGGPPGPAASALLQALPALQAMADPPAWLAAAAPALAKGALQATQLPDPLFSPQTTRALGGALAAVQVADGAVDLDRLVLALAAREPLRALPQQAVWSLRRGLQVLVDTGPGMLPFDADVRQLLGVLQRLLGADRLQVLGFQGEPLHGCRLAESADSEGPTGVGGAPGWPRPAPGVPVLLLTDLGIGQPNGARPRRSATLWRPFVQAASQGGHPLRALLPYGPARWPTGLDPSLRLLCWDRHTTVAAVRRLLAA